MSLKSEKPGFQFKKKKGGIGQLTINWFGDQAERIQIEENIKQLCLKKIKQLIIIANTVHLFASSCFRMIHNIISHAQCFGIEPKNCKIVIENEDLRKSAPIAGFNFQGQIYATVNEARGH